MIFDPRAHPKSDVYRFMVSAVIPRPIALVSTRSTEGDTNVAPFSYFIALSSEPPLIGIAISDRAGDQKDTLQNIRATREFVVNVVSESMFDSMVRAAGEWPRGRSEFDIVGWTPLASERVRAPYVAESPLQMECTLH